MDYSRRDWTLMIPVLTAAACQAQKAPLPSKTFRFEDLPVRPSGENRSRATLDGLTHGGFPIELHQTELAPGLPPHAPHHHEHEEMIMLREGTLEVTIAGKVSTLGPGSVAFVASNEEHGLRNVGKTRAHYFVLALGRAQK